MSVNQGAEDKINKEEAIKIFTKNCTNFNKMNQEEKCEGIKINFISSLEKLSNTLKLDPETTIKLIFENILNKQMEILKSKNLIYSFINLCRKINEKIFQKYFFNLLLIYFSNSSFKKNYSNNYLIDIALDEFFKSESNINEEFVKIKQKLFSFLIENDIKTFECIINKYIFVRKVDKRILLKEKNIFIILELFNKFIAMNKYKSATNIFYYFIEEDNNINDILYCIIKISNEIGFKLIEKYIGTNNIFIVDDAAIFHSLIINYIAENNIEIENEITDTYLINLLNFLVYYSSFNIDIIQHLFTLFKNNKYKNFNEIFPISLYYLSQFTYTQYHINFLINQVFESKSMSAIYEWIMYKNLSYFNKVSSIKGDYKPRPMILTIINDETKYQKRNFELPKIISSLSKLSKLSLLDYIMNDTITITSIKGTEELFILFNEVRFHHIIKLLNRLNLMEISPQLTEILSLFIIDFISSILDISIASKQPITSGKLMEDCLNIIKKTNIEYQESVLYIGIIQIMRNTLFLSYDDLFIKKKNKNEIIDIFFEYLLEFVRNDQVSNLVFKLLIALFKEKSIKTLQCKNYAIDKLVKLCIIANNAKIFELFFKFFNELLKKEQTDEGKNAQYAMYTYSKYYENVLFDSLLNLSLQKFKEVFEDKRLNISFDNKTFFTFALMSQIYSKDKPQQLQEKIDYYTDKFVDVLKYLILKTENLPSIYNIINNNNNGLNNYEKLKDFISFFEYNEFLLLNDNDKNKELICAIGIIKCFSDIISEYIQNFLSNTFIQDEDESEKRIIEEKISLVFDYIFELILSEKKNPIYLIIINEILYKNENLNYFITNHSNTIANKRIKDKEEDFSKLVDYTIDISFEKNNGIFSYINDNPYNILLMNNLILSLCRYETILLNKNEEQNESQIKKHLIIQSIWNNSLFSDNPNEKIFNDKTINSLFISIFLNNIFKIDEIDKNQPLFCYLCDNCFFSNNFVDYPELLKLDYILVEYYSIIRLKRNKLKEKFLQFLLKFLSNMNVNICSLRLLSNYTTFLIIIKDCSDNELSVLFDIINNVIENLILFNSYQNETKEICENIINNIEKYLLEKVNDNPLFIKKEIVYYGQLLLNIFKDKLQINDEQKKKNEINPKLKSHFNNILSNQYIPNYINIFYKCIHCLYGEEKRKEYLNEINEYHLNDLYFAFNIILSFKFNSIILDLNKNLQDENLKNFINEYGNFNLNECSVNSMNNVLENYSNHIYNKGDNFNKFFNENLFVYLLFNNNANLKEETLNNLILIFLDEKDSKIEWENIYDKKKFGFFIVYFELLILKNKNLNFDPTFLFKDFEILIHIGERLQNELNSSNQKK